MKYLLTCIFILTSVFLSGCQDGSLFSDLISEAGQQANYPHIIYAKPADEIAVLQSEFDSLNENKICMVLDRFGFTDDSHCGEKLVDENIVDEKEILSMVKYTLVKNSKFTNVIDTSSLKVRKFAQVGQSSYHHKIYFEDQVIEGLTVEQSRIVVFFYGNYVYRIEGSWYPEFPIPPEGFGYTVSMAKNKIVWKKYEYSCWTPSEIMITPQSIMDEFTERCIHPIVSDESIEFRVVYRFSIGWGEPQHPSFHIYVDIITGEIIEFIQLFRC
ncbi:MAG: hypothetical protein KAV45_15820 [Calditrichia bacterium]|nr:hypothetical protein [Calditrichia bacterium]